MTRFDRAEILGAISKQRKLVRVAMLDAQGGRPAHPQREASLLFRLSQEARDLGISARAIRAAGGLGVAG